LVATEHDPFFGGAFGPFGGLGPPFDLTEQQIRALFEEPSEGGFEVAVLKREDRMPLEPNWTKRGCSYFNEATYLLTRK